MAGVKIQYGADEDSYERLIGQDFGSAVVVARALLGVPAGVEARLNGSTSASSDTVLVDGDVISFYKPSGSKGY